MASSGALFARAQPEVRRDLGRVLKASGSSTVEMNAAATSRLTPGTLASRSTTGSLLARTNLVDAQVHLRQGGLDGFQRAQQGLDSGASRTPATRPCHVRDKVLDGARFKAHAAPLQDAAYMRDRTLARVHQGAVALLQFRAAAARRRPAHGRRLHARAQAQVPASRHPADRFCVRARPSRSAAVLVSCRTRTALAPAPHHIVNVSRLAAGLETHARRGRPLAQQRRQRLHRGTRPRPITRPSLTSHQSTADFPRSNAIVRIAGSPWAPVSLRR